MTSPNLEPDGDMRIVRDMTIPYAKLARHITAMYEIVRLAPTNDPGQPGSPSIGLSLRDRLVITEQLRECLDMIATIERWMLTSATVVQVDQTSDVPAWISDPDLFRRREALNRFEVAWFGRGRKDDDASESRMT